METTDLIEIWEGILRELQKKVDPKIYTTWFETSIIPYMYQNDTLILDTTNKFICLYITRKYGQLLKETATLVIGSETNVELINSEDKTIIPEEPVAETIHHVKPQQQQPVDTEPTVQEELTQISSVPSATTEQRNTDTIKPTGYTELNDMYTFDNFIVGNSNRIAYSAALSIAEAPAKKYNPFFIYGGSGLGKTHLMQAIGHSLLEKFPTLRLHCITSEDFTNDMIHSLRDKNPESFRQKYRNIDVLLVDDIQFLEDKERTQEEFFHTFNTLFRDRKQMVFTSDRPPQDIKKLEDRLRSRFQGGMVVNIDPPDLETRMAILLSLAQKEHIAVDKKAIDYIASYMSTNVRELEGAFFRAQMQASAENSPITLEITQKALKELVSVNNDKKYITIDEITATVCRFYKVKYEDLMSKKKTKNIALPRQIAMYLCRELTENTYPHIGTAFNGRDHTTVMHACTKIMKTMETDEHFRAMIEELKNKIKNVNA